MSTLGAAALLLALAAPAPAPAEAAEMERARAGQDRAALEKMVARLSAAAEKSPRDASAQYQAALAASYLAEVALELRDRVQAERAAENGIAAAERAIALRPDTSEYHRVLGTLCGQVIPANVLSGLTYGKRARDAVNKALELDPRNARAYLARGVGYYYLPPMLGGGMPAAATDFRKAIELNPAYADAHLWLGLALRRQGQNAAARQALAKALELEPQRIWIKQQFEKTPSQ